MKKLLREGAVTSRYPLVRSSFALKTRLLGFLIRSTQGRKWAHPSTWPYRCVTPLSGSGSPGDVALARANRANNEPLIKRMPLGQHPGIGRVSLNIGTLAASLLLEAVLYPDDKQFFMLCFSVSAHCSTSGCFRLQAWRSHLARKHGRDSGLFRPPTRIRKRPARTRAPHPARGLPSGHAWLSRS